MPRAFCRCREISKSVSFFSSRAFFKCTKRRGLCRPARAFFPGRGRLFVYGELFVKTSFKIAAAAAAVLASVSSAHAAGFMLSEQSVAGLGRAYAGAGIVGDDLSAVWYNPAGMVLLPGTQVQLGGVYVELDLEYSGFDGTSENGRQSGVPIPNLFFTHQMNDSMWFGVGLTVPYGLATEYDRDWSNWKRGMNAEIKVFDLNPSFAWKVSDKLAIGAGISIQYADAKYETGSQFETPLGLFEGYGRLSADSLAWGGNIGIMWSPTENLRFGLAYRSQINHHAKGDLRLGQAALHPGNSGYDGTFDNASASLSAPQTVLLTGTWEATPQLRISALIRWADWSSFDSLGISASDFHGNPMMEMILASMGGSISPDIDHKWQDTWLFTLGADYTINSAWTVRAGIGYETSPIDDERYRTPLIPDADRLWLSVGATWHVTENLQGDFGFTWLHGVGGDALLYGNENDAEPAGKYSTLDAYLFGAQMVYRF